MSEYWGRGWKPYAAKHPALFGETNFSAASRQEPQSEPQINTLPCRPSGRRSDDQWDFRLYDHMLVVSDYIDWLLIQVQLDQGFVSFTLRMLSTTHAFRQKSHLGFAQSFLSPLSHKTRTLAVLNVRSPWMPCRARWCSWGVGAHSV